MLALLAQASGYGQGLAQFRGGREENYYFPYWFVGLLAAYIISFILVKRKKLSLAIQRKFWNFWLGIFFLKTAILGLLLVFRSQYHLQVTLPFNLDLKFWHVEAGIAFSVIAIFHILWHGAYIKALFKK